MRSSDKVALAVVGLGFGQDFLPVYLAHPGVREVAIVDTSAERLAEVGDRFGIAARYTDYDEMLADPRWDAVHLLVPVALHAQYAVAALEAGKHCACAVPMALEIDDLRRVVAAEDASGRRYMMMETTVYGREFRFIRSQLAAGRLGAITGYRGFHHQNLDGYPRYWLGYPPMKYATHALAPLLALTGSEVASVVAYGTGRLSAERRGDFDNPFPAERGLFTLTASDVVAEIAMSFFQVARPYIEGFDVHGDRRSVEWPAEHEGPLLVHDLQPLEDHRPETGLRGRRALTEHVVPPDDVSDLPPEVARFVTDFEIRPADGGATIRRPAEHGGSHPHLVHEFVSAIIEDRPTAIDARRSAAWTAPGICAHESALADGARITVPTF